MIDKQIRRDLDDMQKHTAETKYFKNPNAVDKFDSNINNIYKVQANICKTLRSF